MVFDHGLPSNLDIGLRVVGDESTWKPLLASEYSESEPAISPDGQWIAYVSNQTGSDEIYLERFPDLGDRRLVSTGGGRHPVWSRGGRELFYFEEGRRMMSVPIENEPVFATGKPQMLFEGDSFRITYDVDPAGQRFLMVKREYAGSETNTNVDLVFVQNWFEELKRLVPTD